jgi:hypothetical protein
MNRKSSCGYAPHFFVLMYERKQDEKDDSCFKNQKLIEKKKKKL